jgi:hypothetical protein
MTSTDDEPTAVDVNAKPKAGPHRWKPGESGNPRGMTRRVSMQNRISNCATTSVQLPAA